MEISNILNNLDINIKDKRLLYEVIKVFKNDVDCKDFANRAESELNRGYSGIRKRLKRIIDENEEIIHDKLNIKVEDLTSKSFIQEIVIRVNDNEGND